MKSLWLGHMVYLHKGGCWLCGSSSSNGSHYSTIF